MVNWMRPNYLGTQQSFHARFKVPIVKGQSAHSKKEERTFSSQRGYVLHHMLKDCVQRVSHDKLARDLPPKTEYVVSIRLTKLQRKLYRAYIDFLENPKENSKNALSKGFLESSGKLMLVSMSLAPGMCH